MQTSCVPPPELDVGGTCVGSACWVTEVGAPVVGSNPGVPEVGSGRGVLEGGRVGLAASVGGMEVAVGTEACVSATIVKAAASAVF